MLSIIAEFLCLLVAVFRYRQLKDTIYVYAIPFLFFVVFAEMGAVYHNYAFRSPKYPNGNTHIYLWVSIVETLFYSYFFHQYISSKIAKKWIAVLAVLLINTYLFLFFFYAVYVETYYYLMTLAGLYFTLLSCIYFYKLFIYTEEENVIYLPDFWMAAGIFVFFSGVSLSFALHKTLAHPNIRIMNMSLYNFIPQVLSIILYGCFAVTFILCRKKKTT